MIISLLLPISGCDTASHTSLKVSVALPEPNGRIELYFMESPSEEKLRLAETAKVVETTPLPLGVRAKLQGQGVRLIMYD